MTSKRIFTVHPYKLVVFDLDGTLMDTSEGIASALEETIAYYGYEKPSQEEFRTFIGPPIQKSFERAYGVSGDALSEMSLHFRTRYSEMDLLKATPYEGIYTLLAKLENCGVKTTVATYKREDYALKLLKHFHFDTYMNGMFGSDFAGKLTKSDIIKNAISASGIMDYKDVVMIGDSDNDAVGAEKLGVDFIGVTYGFGFESFEDVREYKHVGMASNCQELCALLTEDR